MTKKLIVLLAVLPLMTACTRVSVGSFTSADSGEADAVSVDGNTNIREERSLTRLHDIDQSIQDSMDRLDAALDPNADSKPANLDKLVQNNEIDPALKNDRNLYRNAVIDQKIDDKNRALINDELSGNLDSVSENTGQNPDDFSNRELKQTAQIDQKLDEKAQSAIDKNNDQTSDSSSDSSSNNGDSQDSGSTDSSSTDANAQSEASF